MPNNHEPTIEQPQTVCSASEAAQRLGELRAAALARLRGTPPVPVAPAAASLCGYAATPNDAIVEMSAQPERPAAMIGDLPQQAAEQRAQKALAERAQADAALARAQMEAALRGAAAAKAQEEAAALREELARRTGGAVRQSDGDAQPAVAPTGGDNRGVGMVGYDDTPPGASEDIAPSRPQATDSSADAAAGAMARSRSLAKPLVTVVYLTYNQEKYALEAVRSVLDQTYPNLEIIILDDASSDATADLIAAELAKCDRQPRPRLIRNPRNLGESDNTRKGLALAGGDFIVLFNGDDVMLPEMVDEMVGVWQRDRVSLVTVNGYVVDQQGTVLRHWRDPAAPFDDSFETLARDGANAVCFGAGMGFEREIYTEFGWPPAYLTTEDIMVPFYAYLRKGARFLPQPLINYRVHGNNASMSLQREAAKSKIHRLFIETEDFCSHLAHASLMMAGVDRLSVENPSRYGDLRSGLQPLLTTQIVEMAKKLVNARVELHNEGVDLAKLPRLLADVTAPKSDPGASAPAAEATLDCAADYLRFAASVPGWRQREEAVALFEAAYSLPGHPVIVEVGSFFGRSSVLLAGACKLRGSGKLHCVDPFDCSGDSGSAIEYRRLLEENGGGPLRKHFERTIARAGLLDWVEVHEGTAAAIAASWERPIDLLLLDGDHSPAGARLGYDSWARHLRDGALLAVDNSVEREFAKDHDGNYRVVTENVVAPAYGDIRQIGCSTFARKASAGAGRSFGPLQGQMAAALQATGAEKAQAEAAALRAELAARDALIARISGAKRFGEPVSADPRPQPGSGAIVPPAASPLRLRPGHQAGMPDERRVASADRRSNSDRRTGGPDRRQTDPAGYAQIGRCSAALPVARTGASDRRVAGHDRRTGAADRRAAA